MGRVTRDSAIVTFSLVMGAMEILVLGARAPVLTFLTGLLLTPVVLRYEETRKEEKQSDDHEQDHA